MATSRLMFAALTAGSLFAAQASDSETPQRLIRLTVVATDAKGQPVTNLQPADVRLREDGKVRPIAFFRYAGARRLNPPLPVGETLNRPPVPPTLILFDRWNEQMMTAASAWGDVGGALEKLESVESVYIYFLTNHGDLYPVHPLPATDADLHSASPPTPKQLRAELDDAVRKLNGFRDIGVWDPVFRANTTLRALGALGMQMASLAGRKNFIWVTHGIPLSARVPDRPEWVDFTPQVRQFSVAAAQSQIAIYTVDESAQGAGADVAGQSRAALEMFAALTGGRWYASGNADEALSGAMTDARGSYRIAYYSPFRDKDNKEHKIRLDAAPKGVRLLSREGYFGNIPEPDPDELEQGVFRSLRRSPFDAGEIGLRVEFSRMGKNAHLAIRVNASDVLLEKRGGRYQGSLGVMLAFYQDGFLKAASNAKTVDLDLTGEKYDQALKDGILIEEDAPLSDQIQKVRVMVFDPMLEALGSTTIDAK
jgi:VWFA-related protein